MSKVSARLSKRVSPAVGTASRNHWSKPRCRQWASPSPATVSRTKCGEMRTAPETSASTTPLGAWVTAMLLAATGLLG